MRTQQDQATDQPTKQQPTAKCPTAKLQLVLAVTLG